MLANGGRMCLPALQLLIEGNHEAVTEDGRTRLQIDRRDTDVPLRSARCEFLLLKDPAPAGA